MAEKEVGEVITFFSHVSVAAIKLKDNLRIGDRIRFSGHTTDFEQLVDSMQIDKKEVKEAKKGDKMGIKVNERVRLGDKLILIE